MKTVLGVKNYKFCEGRSLLVTPDNNEVMGIHASGNYVQKRIRLREINDLEGALATLSITSECLRCLQISCGGDRTGIKNNLTRD
jgi:hypothetical protein